MTDASRTCPDEQMGRKRLCGQQELEMLQDEDFLTTMPTEILRMILRLVDVRDVLSIASTSRRLREVARSSAVWEKKEVEVAATKKFDVDIKKWLFLDSRPGCSEMTLAKRILLLAPCLKYLKVNVSASCAEDLRRTLSMRRQPLHVSELVWETVGGTMTTGKSPAALRAALSYNLSHISKLSVWDITLRDLRVILNLEFLKDLTIYYFRKAEFENKSLSFPAAARLDADPGRVRARLQRLILGRFCPPHVLDQMVQLNYKTLVAVTCWGSSLSSMKELARCSGLREAVVGPGPHLHLLQLPRLGVLTLDVTGHTSYLERCSALQQAAPHLATLRVRCAALSELRVLCGCRSRQPCAGRAVLRSLAEAGLSGIALSPCSSSSGNLRQYQC